MDSVREFLKRKLWLAFLIHQLLIFAVALDF